MLTIIAEETKNTLREKSFGGVLYVILINIDIRITGEIKNGKQ